MSPKGHDEVLCGNPNCARPVHQKPGSGRPRKYCDDRCANAAHRAARRASNAASTYRPVRPEAVQNAKYVQELAYDLTQQANRLLESTAHHGAQDLEQSLRAFQESQRMTSDLQDLTAALAQQCRDRGAKSSDLAKAGHVSASTVKRNWPDSPSRIRERMENHRQRLQANRATPRSFPPAAQRPVTSSQSAAAADDRRTPTPDKSPQPRRRPLALPAVASNTSGHRTYRPATKLRQQTMTFTAFHASHRKLWMLFAHLTLGSSAAAEQVVDAAFATLRRQWGHALGQHNLRAYAWQILRGKIAARRTSHGDVQMVRNAAFDAAVRKIALQGGRDTFAALEDTLSLYQHISTLPSRQFEAIVLRYALDLAEDEIADHLGLKPATIRSHLDLAEIKLAKLLTVENPQKED